MSLSVITPVLNEETFLPLFLDSVCSYANEIIIADGGSTDSSLDIIRRYRRKYNVHLYEMRQKGRPYSTDWRESEVRNFLVRKATGKWIANLDADELFDDKIVGELPKLMARRDVDVYQFPFINFWETPWTIRVNAPGDERWSNDIVRMWRAGIGIRYRDQAHHCTLQTKNGGSIWTLPLVRADIPLYHYHYALGKRIKTNDNRRGDVNMYENAGDPDWKYRHGEYEICTKPFHGRHPSIVRKYMAKG